MPSYNHSLGSSGSTESSEDVLAALSRKASEIVPSDKPALGHELLSYRRRGTRPHHELLRLGPSTVLATSIHLDPLGSGGSSDLLQSLLLLARGGLVRSEAGRCELLLGGSGLAACHSCIEDRGHMLRLLGLAR